VVTFVENEKRIYHEKKRLVGKSEGKKIWQRVWLKRVEPEAWGYERDN